jgi:hypothetical protein
MQRLRQLVKGEEKVCVVWSGLQRCSAAFLLVCFAIMFSEWEQQLRVSTVPVHETYVISDVGEEEVTSFFFFSFLSLQI